MPTTPPAEPVDANPPAPRKASPPGCSGNSDAWSQSQAIERRRKRILSDILRRFEQCEEIENGYKLAYSARSIPPARLARHVEFLRQHYRALAFDLQEPHGPALRWLKITGSAEAKEHLDHVLSHPPRRDSRLQHLLRRGTQLATSPWRVLPDFLIIGAAKAGTTSLYSYLGQHPGFAAASKKEVYFFDLQYERGLAWYRSHFPTAAAMRQHARLAGGTSVTGEATPCYMIHPHAPQRIRAVLPEVRLIVLLRNPVQRAYSFWQMQYRRGHETLSFEEALDREEARLAGEWERMLADPRYNSHPYNLHSYLLRGHYAEQLERWFAVFPRERFLILGSEAMYADPQHTLDQVYGFLGLPPVQKTESRRYDRDNYVPYERMSPETTLRLQRYFAPHNRKLYALLGRDFGWDR